MARRHTKGGFVVGFMGRHSVADLAEAYKKTHGAPARRVLLHPKAQASTVEREAQALGLEVERSSSLLLHEIWVGE